MSVMADPAVADVYLEKAKAQDLFGQPPKELTVHPYLWHKLEAEIVQLGGDVHFEIVTINGERRKVLEGLLVCLDSEFPVDQILVS